MNSRKILTLSFGLILILGACQKKEGCTDINATNYDSEAEVDDASCEYEEGLNIPATYSFTDANGNNTVNFNGQQQRLEMLSEMTTYMKTANTPGTAIETSILIEMYANNGHTWVDVDGLGMTGSTKNLMNKTAASTGSPDPAVITVFEELMADMATASSQTEVDNPDGAQGQSGVVVSTTNPSKQYLFDAHGSEYTQRIEKGLMGAVFYNQISLWYLANDQMNVDNSTAVDPDNGKYYTQMEHHWDEAYGYFTSSVDYPVSGTDRFWGKYAYGREDLMGSATIISNAFKTGRAAITAGDLDTRDAQITIIRTELERVAAASAVHYLNDAMANLTDPALRNHALSEAVPFMEAIQFGYEPQLSSTHIQGLIGTLGDFYQISTTAINVVKDDLVDTYGFHEIQDEL